jgi:small-conductance mechanosensitive channel
MVLDLSSRLPALTLGVLCLITAPVATQQPPEEPAAEATASDTADMAADATDTATPSEPVPIPIADLPSRIAALNANVRRIVTLVEPKEAVTNIGAALSDQAQTIVELRTALNALDPQRATVKRIEDQHVGWTEFDTTLARRLDVLQSRWSELQSEQTELREATARWTLTRSNAVSEEAQPEVIQRIDSVLSSLAQTEAVVRRRSDTLAVMLDRMARAEEVVEESFDRLAALEETARRRVLTRDAEPFWRGLAVPDVGLFLNDIRQEREYWLNTLREFVEERQGRFTVLGGIFAVVLIASVALRRWSYSWPEDNRLEPARHVASRPVSTALAISLVSMSLLFRRPVGPLSDVVAILALVPVFRLGVGLAQPHIRRLMYGVTTILTLFLLVTFTPDGSFLRRLFMILVSAAGISGAIWLIRRWRRTDIVSRSYTAQVGLVGLQLATGLLVVALLANLLGWFALSQLLLQATVFSAYSAVAWRVVSLTLNALVPIAPYSVVGRILPSIARYETTFVQRTTAVIATVAVLVWSRSTLINFRLFDTLWEQAGLALAFTISAGGLELSVGRLMLALTILSITLPVASLVKFVLTEEILPRLPLPPGVNHTVVAIVNYTVVIVGILLAGSAAGLTATQLTVAFGALGVGIGFGLQSVVNNFVSGLILMFERPIKVGDRIETTGRLGIVTRIGMRASMIRTFDGAEVVVPNGDLISKEVINWTLSDQRRRVEVTVRVAEGSDVQTVMGVLQEVGSSHPDVLDDPAPAALMLGANDGALEFRLLAWSQVENTLKTTSDLNVQVYEALEAAGVRSAIPQRDLHVRSVAAGSALVVDRMAPDREAKTRRTV